MKSADTHKLKTPLMEGEQGEWQQEKTMHERRSKRMSRERQEEQTRKTHQFIFVEELDE